MTNRATANSISNTEYIARQYALLEQCEPNSIVVIRSGSEVTRSRDTEFPFRQDSDFFYLTGFNEPDSWLILSNQLGNQESEGGDIYRAMAVRPSDPEQEIWHGRRLGVDNAEHEFDLDVCCTTDEIADALLALIDGHEGIYWSMGHHKESDSLVPEVLAQLKSSRTAKAPKAIYDWQPLVHEMRLFKSPRELAVMQQAADMSCDAHKNAMGYATPNCYEYQLAGVVHHTFAMAGAAAPAYNTIAGGGVNACILHYTENSDQIANGDLVLIDGGAEFQGYASDITRTFPVNGKFSDAQKQVYNLVLEAQAAAIELLVPGKTLPQANTVVIEILTEGLIELGLLSGDLDTLIANNAYKRFYMHGLGHWLGLDVHDVGVYKLNGEDRSLEQGMVLTVEPGLYIPDEDDIPSAYRGIGVRIEDNIVITSSGNRVLTDNAPKSVDDIEALMISGNE